LESSPGFGCNWSCRSRSAGSARLLASQNELASSFPATFVSGLPGLRHQASLRREEFPRLRPLQLRPEQAHCLGDREGRARSSSAASVSGRDSNVIRTEAGERSQACCAIEDWMCPRFLQYSSSRGWSARRNTNWRRWYGRCESGTGRFRIAGYACHESSSGSHWIHGDECGGCARERHEIIQAAQEHSWVVREPGAVHALANEAPMKFVDQPRRNQ
jgi:hypothetical protein